MKKFKFFVSVSLLILTISLTLTAKNVQSTHLNHEVKSTIIEEVMDKIKISHKKNEITDIIEKYIAKGDSASLVESYFLAMKFKISHIPKKNKKEREIIATYTMVGCLGYAKIQIQVIFNNEKVQEYSGVILYYNYTL